MNDWKIIFAERAELDLREIYAYISEYLLEPETARNAIKNIINVIDGLSSFPNRHTLYDEEPWKSLGLRRSNAGNFAVFYCAYEAEKIVRIIRVIYGGRDIGEVLNETHSK
jgi:toxin ParE1/3/4